MVAQTRRISPGSGLNVDTAMPCARPERPAWSEPSPRARSSTSDLSRIARVDLTLSDEQQLIRDTARAFCDAEIAPHAAEWDRTETIDRGIVGKLAELGFLAAALPEEHGGMGLDMVSYALVVEGVGPADSNVRRILSRSDGLYV